MSQIIVTKSILFSYYDPNHHQCAGVLRTGRVVGYGLKVPSLVQPNQEKLVVLKAWSLSGIIYIYIYIVNIYIRTRHLLCFIFEFNVQL